MGTARVAGTAARPTRARAASIATVKLTIETQVMSLPLRDPFRIARDEDDRTATTVIVTISTSGLQGVGEAFPVAYYGETVGTIGVVLPAAGWRRGCAGRAAHEPASPPAPGSTTRAAGWPPPSGITVAPRPAWTSRSTTSWRAAWGCPLWQLLETPAEIPPTDFSIGIDTPAAVAERASRAASFPMLKIKVGGPSDLETLEAVRAVYPGRSGWMPTPAGSPRKAPGWCRSWNGSAWS